MLHSSKRGIFMKFSRNPDIKASFECFLRLLFQSSAGRDIIFHSLFKSIFYFFYRCTFEVDYVVNSKQFSIEYFVLRTILYSAQVFFIFQIVTHLKFSLSLLDYLLLV